jgi:hypothetical protein
MLASVPVFHKPDKGPSVPSYRHRQGPRPQERFPSRCPRAQQPQEHPPQPPPGQTEQWVWGTGRRLPPPFLYV